MLNTQSLEKFEGRLCHELEHGILRMLRCNLQTAGCMLQNKFLKIWIRCFVHITLLVKEEIISDAAADVSVLDTLYLCYPFV